MVHVLIVGYAPDAVDFTDPTVPPGVDADVIATGIRQDLKLMHDRGWDAEHLSLRMDEDLHERIACHLKSRSYDCIVIGAGVRMTENHVPELEQIVNAVRTAAPGTPLAFNSGLNTSATAAARWILR